ncbi:MAG: carbonic anhydrase [Heliobacteriaceae bacterium]|nr:carbonic anhydrase [Heliobacteriaceae bacterium]MDD4587725.1 carbonic anhydrase [Heliobacteriaceae bacterium]
MKLKIITTAGEAKSLLVEGNKRYVAGKLAGKDLGPARRQELVTKGQHPFAAIVTCSDSRVPPELIFDQALGDLFVIRVAGNVLDPVVVGSVEYAAEHLETPLVVVMGHEKCGAVQATVEGGEAPGSIGALVDRIKPALEKVQASGVSGSELCEQVCDENIRRVVGELAQSPVINHLVHSGKVTLTGAKYYLGSGEVVFFA